MTRALLPTLLLACCLLSGLPASTRAQAAGSIDVTGVVGDAETGRPIGGALVELPELERRTMTDANGRFVFLDLPPGPHRLRVGTLGYAAWEEEAVEMEHLDLLRVGLLPQPIALENIRVTSDRLEQRRRLSTAAVFAVGRDEVLALGFTSVAEVVDSRTVQQRVPCGTASGLMPYGALSGGADPESYCIRYRGRVVRPEIYVDEVPAQFIELGSYHPAEIYAVEYYEGGREIRIYTTAFMERGGRLRPRGF